jgi:F420-non-reducing hydrogenase iron-sulfur subunit
MIRDPHTHPEVDARDDHFYIPIDQSGSVVVQFNIKLHHNYHTEQLMTYTEPRILAILCNWCSYSAADQAGASKREYPSSIRIMRVMCTGRVDPTHVMEALAGGMDGVLVCGCHPGDCHYINGNCRASGRIGLLRKMLVSMGLEPQRLRLEWISASESEKFAEVAREMHQQILELGPLSWPTVKCNTDAMQSIESNARGRAR